MGAISIRPNYSQTNHNVKKIQIHTTPSNSTRATQYPYTCICTLSNCKHRNFLSFPHLNVHFFMWILLSLSMCRFLQLRNRRFVVTVDSPFLTDFLFTYVHLHDWHILNLTHWTNKFRCNVVMRELNVGFANITIVVFHTALCIFNFDFAIVNEPHWISLVFFFCTYFICWPNFQLKLLTFNFVRLVTKPPFDSTDQPQNYHNISKCVSI